MYVCSRKKQCFDLDWNNEGVKYKSFLLPKKNFLLIILVQIRTLCLKILKILKTNVNRGEKTFIAAYDQCLKASHIFNLLDARGVIGVAERTGYITRIKNLQVVAHCG